MRKRRSAQRAGLEVIRLVLALACAVSAALFITQPAWAKETHLLISSFKGEACKGFGELEGVAVDNSASSDAGDVYVADRGHGVIDRFDASGDKCLGQNSGAGTPQKSFVNGPLGQLAVSPMSGDLFVSLFREGLVDVFDPTEVYLFQISGQNIPEGKVGHPPPGAPFAPEATAVDLNTSEVFVADEANNEIDVFTSTGEYVRQFPVGGPPLSLAINAHDVLYVANTLDVEVYEASTGKLESIFETSATETDPKLAVEPGTEDVYVAHRRNRVVNQYSSSGVLVGSFENSGESHGIAVSKESLDLYLTTMKSGQGEVTIFGPAVTAAEPTTEEASEVKPESAVLNGEVNPNGLPVKECYFEYAPVGEPYKATVPCEHPDAAEIPEAEGEHPVHAKVTLQAEISYHFRLVAVNAQATLDGSDVAIELPTAEADAVHTIDGQGELSVFGVVSPKGAKAGYHFEFVTQKQLEEEGAGAWAHAVATPEVQANGGEELVFQQVPSTLSAGETYRYRLMTESTAFPGDPQHSRETRTVTVPTPGSETQPPCPNEAERTGPSAQLPDCRAYEQVTPVDKEGAQDIFDYGKTTDEAVVGLDGEHLLVYTLSKWGQNVSGAATGTYPFTRTPAGWQMGSLSPQPQTGGILNKPASFYTPELSQVMLEREWSTSVNAASPTVEFALGPPGGPYKTVASEPQTHIESEGKNHGGEEVAHEGKWVAQSRDGSVAVLESPDHELIAGHPTGTTALNHLDGGQGNQGQDLYEYANGHLEQVNLAPEPEGKATIGTCGAELAEGREGGGNRGLGQGTEGANISLDTGSVNAASKDGSRIFFEAFPHGCPNVKEEGLRNRGVGGEVPKLELYMRVNGERTVDIGNYTFEGANPEGTRVFMSGVSGSGVEYFSYDTETQSIKPLFSLKGDALGLKHALSEDGNVYYFEATGTPLNAEAPANVNDIYRYDIDTETLTFVAVSSQSEGDGSGGFYVSPDGKDFYFNVEAVAGVSGSAGGKSHPVEVYRYDSGENMAQCVSCASPFNPEPRLLSTFMPEFGPIITRLAPLGSPASTNGDFVFFDTPAALVSQDIDGEVLHNGVPTEEYFSLFFSPSSDVYEWRKEGVDGCGRVQGCLTLITNGIDGTENVLLGTDPSGRDVFIGTHSQLAPTDTDQSGDVYDVRMGGGFSPPPPPPTRCEGDTCSTPAVPPIEVTPSSFTFNGPTDAAPELSSSGGARGASAKAVKCAKGRVAVRGRCVKRGARTNAKKARVKSRGARARHSGRSAGRRGR